MMEDSKRMKYKIKEYPDLKIKIDKMSIDDLLRSVACPQLTVGKTPDAENNPVAFLFPSDIEGCQKMTHLVNDNKKEKTLFTCDMENGPGCTINGTAIFPSMRAAADTGDEDLVYRMGKYTAIEAVKSGIHWNFAPCVDILGNDKNPIVSLRAPGNNPEAAIKFGGAFMKGLQDNGMISCLKHFPGDGFCDCDQHVNLPVIPLSKDEWWSTYGKVYKQLINDGAKSIMPGHFSFPAMDDKDPYKGIYGPISISKKILTGLLKDELGFDGIIISDAVNMGGFAGYMNMYHASALFLENGGDCLLFMHSDDEYLDNMKKQINDGVLSIESLKNRSYRLHCFSREYFETFDDTKEYDKNEAKKDIMTMVKKTVKITRDRFKVLPLSLNKNTNILHCVFTMPDYPENSWKNMTAALKKKCNIVDEITDCRPWIIKEAVKSRKYDYVICTVGVNPMYGLNTASLAGIPARNMMEGWQNMGVPVIYISYGNDRFGQEYSAIADTVIDTYGFVNETTNAVIDLLQNGYTK